MKVGDTVYVFDENNREYNRDARGKTYGGPIYRKYFVETKIVSETTRSWVVAPYNQKYLKRPTHPTSGVLTIEQVHDLVWINEHRYRIADRVGRLRDVAQLKAIASVIGYADDQA